MDVKTAGPGACASQPPKDVSGTPREPSAALTSCHLTVLPATFSQALFQVTHLSSSEPLAGSPHPRSSPPLIHPIWFSGSPYYHSPLLSPAPSCPFWVAAYGQAETCGTVAAAGSKVTGVVSLRVSWDGTEGAPVTRKIRQK